MSSAPVGPSGTAGGWLQECLASWDRFWFAPRNPATLSLMRILVGSMLVYTHAVWTLELNTFVSPLGIFDARYSGEFHGNSPYAWTHFMWLDDSPAWVWGTHFLALAVMLAFAAGFWTRASGLLSALLVISYAHRAGGLCLAWIKSTGFCRCIWRWVPAVPCIRSTPGGSAAGQPAMPPGSDRCRR